MSLRPPAPEPAHCRTQRILSGDQLLGLYCGGVTANGASDLSPAGRWPVHRSAPTRHAWQINNLVALYAYQLVYFAPLERRDGGRRAASNLALLVTRTSTAQDIMSGAIDRAIHRRRLLPDCRTGLAERRCRGAIRKARARISSTAG
jgi:hypothetical protein